MSSTNNKSFNTCIIYHNHCNDGFGSALAARKIFGDSAIYWPANHDQDPPDVKGMDVYILDYCYKRPILENMVKVANKVIVIDHHKTAEAELSDMEETSKFQKVFDMNHSGAVLTYKYFFPNEQLPLLFSYIEDRDIWLKKMPDTAEVSAALFGLQKEFSIWEEYLVDENIDKLIDIGKKVLAHIEVEVNNLARNSYLDEWSLILDNERITFNVAVCNSPLYQSDLGNYLVTKKFKDQADFAAIWNFDGTINKTKFSLRSTNEKQDISIIAKLFGGGGHRNASGCTVDGLVPKLETDFSLLEFTDL
tara:strand:+ start:2857 stop:3774 length:918 start_codon:yes stop_codon:yes gene_type:complete